MLIVGLNDDASVRRLKGPGRPLIGERQRAAILAALGCVDYVVMFDDDTPLALLERIKPDVLVKGGTYAAGRSRRPRVRRKLRRARTRHTPGRRYFHERPDRLVPATRDSTDRVTPAAAALGASRRISDSEPKSMKLGIFLPNWIGDVAMATPTLRALRQHFGPQAELIGILRPYVVDVLVGTPWLDRTIECEPRSRNPARRGWRLVRELRQAKLDMAILLTNSLRSGLLAWASGARERIGYVRGIRGPLLSRKLYPLRQRGKLVPMPAVDYFLDLAYAAGCPPQSPRLELATTSDDQHQADRVWSRLRLPEGRQVIVLNSGGAFGSAKLWPSEYFAVLARRIATELDRHVLVLCGPHERPLARQIVAEASHPQVHSLADERLGIGLTKACIRRSRLLVTTDSGPRHFAAAFDVPAITLFGPTHIQWSENHHPLAVHLQLQLDCGPCQRRACPLGHHACMRNLSPEQVFRAVAQQLAKTSDSKAA